MSLRPTTVERAFQLAREGNNAAEIRRRLAKEGYPDGAAQLAGRSIKAQLRQLCADALAEAPPTDEA